MAASATARRRVPKRAGRPAVRWDRLGRIALMVTLGVILLLYVSPTKHWIEQSRTARAQKQELEALTAQNQRLKRSVKALGQPSALEREARRLGMVRQGERSYVIRPAPR
jgi:cell division protein FtsB